MSTTRKMGSGLAFTPEKDLRMFADMARRGKHLDGTANLWHGWSFVDGDPEEAVFDLAYEDDPSPDYFDIFRGAGWEPVVSLGNVHVFKAAPGATPVHTSIESRREELLRNRNQYVRYALVALVVFALVVLGLALVSWNEWVEAALLVVFVFPVVYTVLPLFGYWYRLGRTRNSH